MKEVIITPPEGYEIDKENSTFECIKFKPIFTFRINNSIRIGGFFIEGDSHIIGVTNLRNNLDNRNVFATEKQAKSALAMAQISQIIANDKRFGGVITDEEWNDLSISKYAIDRIGCNINKEFHVSNYAFIAFHTAKQRDLFLEENEDLIKDYLML